MICKIKSDGLGGYAGISNTICHGSPKKNNALQASSVITVHVCYYYAVQL